jgi:excisionase family DNA binding protein
MDDKNFNTQFVMSSVPLRQLQTMIGIAVREAIKEIPSPAYNATPSDRLLNIREAADFLSLTVPTMYSKVSKGELPVMKQGKRLYFSQKELTDYVKDGKRKSTAEIEAEAETYINGRS